MAPITWVLFGLAAIAWFIAFVSFIRLLGYRLPGRGVMWYLVRGYSFFDAENFQPEGFGAHRTFVYAAFGFLFALVGMIVLTMVSI